MLDPCMGSGHFLVFALDILVALRKAEEGFDDEAAVIAVLSDNLHGLEIDPRCTQIAAFALALSAWKRIGRVRPLPALNLACSGLAIGMGRAEFVKLAERIAEADGFAGGASDMLGRERNPMEEQALARRRGGMERLYDMFAQAPVLGSLTEPRRALGDYGDLLAEGFDGISGVIGKVLDKADRDPDIREAAVTAQGLAKAAELLGRRFTLVGTNVPYLARGRQDKRLAAYLEGHHREARSDLATAMLSRIFAFLARNSTVCVVTPQNWFFLSSYAKFRAKALSGFAINSVAALGPRAFETISGEVVSPALITISAGNPDHSTTYMGINANDEANPAAKQERIVLGTFNVIQQETQYSSPDHRISTENYIKSNLLEIYAAGVHGLGSKDTPMFFRQFWEVAALAPKWEALQTTAKDTRPFGGCEQIVLWEQGDGLLCERGKRGEAVLAGAMAWGARGVLVSQMGDLAATLFMGDKFDKNTAALVPVSDEHRGAIWAFASSSDFRTEVRKIDQSLAVTNKTLVKVPFDLLRWQHVAAERYPNGLPKPYSNDPTQWLFDGHPRGSADPNTLDADGNPMRPDMAEHPLQVAVARLVGYRWPRQTGSSFMDCPAIDTPDEIDTSDRVDADGIVCLPALAGEAGAAERLRGVLHAAWEADWREGVVRACLQAEDAKAEDLDAWLADEFFDGHCRLFHQAPFVWHVWDGLRGGFSALVNYHNLCAPNGGGRRLLEKLRDTYLGEWIARQRRLASDGDALAEDRLAAAEHLRGELTRIIEGEPPYDVFVRWKALSQQPIGWEPDIDDGVRLNIRPFITARPRGARGAKACILRVRPGVKKYEGADRGGEPYREKADYPWFWAEDHDVATEDFAGGTKFKGRRYNDFHFSRRIKQAARAAPPSGSKAAE